MLAQGRDGLGDSAYQRHQPEQTLLYQLVEAHYPALVDQLNRQSKSLPEHVRQEFDACFKAAAWNMDSSGCAATRTTSSGRPRPMDFHDTPE